MKTSWSYLRAAAAFDAAFDATEAASKLLRSALGSIFSTWSFLEAFWSLLKRLENLLKTSCADTENVEKPFVVFLYFGRVASFGSLARLGSIFEASWAVLERLGCVLERLGGILERLGGVLERLGGVLEASWRRLGGVLECLGASWRRLEASWSPLARD